MLPQEKANSSYQSTPKAKHWPWLGSTISFIICLALGITIVFFKQTIIDSINYYSFKPSQPVSTIASTAKLTQNGLFYFYASLPQVDSADDFNGHCIRQEVSSAILGCYTNERIYIYDLKNDSRLEGVKVVSSAHEILHAAWQRLSSTEKDRLAVLLESAYQRLKTDELKARMDYYDREQPGDHIQELHSILGTELADLGEELNSYYNRYFADRAALVSLHDQYSKIINDNIETQKKLITEINALNQSLNASIVAYNSAVKQLNSDVAALEVERLKIDTTSIYEVSNFNSKRNALIKRINSLESQNTAITADQSKYNDLINQYNQTVIIGNGLTNSLDSTLQAPATL